MGSPYVQFLYIHNMYRKLNVKIDAYILSNTRDFQTLGFLLFWGRGGVLWSREPRMSRVEVEVPGYRAKGVGI